MPVGYAIDGEACLIGNVPLAAGAETDNNNAGRSGERGHG